MTRKQGVVAIVFTIVAMALFFWLAPGSDASGTTPGRAEARSTTQVLAIVGTGSPLAEARQTEGEFVYIDIAWQIAEGPDTERLMSGTANRLKVASSDPRLKELVPGTAVFVSVRADKLIYDNVKYASYLGGYDGEPLTDFLLYRERPFWVLP